MVVNTVRGTVEPTLTEPAGESESPEPTKALFIANTPPSAPKNTPWSYRTNIVLYISFLYDIIHLERTCFRGKES